jgi:hypothetical protein
MLEHQVDVCIEDWTDAEFRHLVGTAWDAVCGGPDDVDSIAAAVRLQLLLRAGGYDGAVVEIHQSVDEALAHVAHFDISREPPKAVGLPLAT